VRYAWKHLQMISGLYEAKELLVNSDDSL